MRKSLFLPEINENTLDDLKELKFDTLHISYERAEPEFIKTLRQKNPDIKINVDVPVFSGKDILDKFSDAVPVEAQNKDLNSEYYYPVCPTHEKAREYILEKIKDLTSRDIDGIWLYSLWYPVKWDNKEPELFDTCYCDRCLKKFSEYIQEPIEGANLEEKVLLIDGAFYFEWLEFKAAQINSFAEKVKDIVKNCGKRMELGVFIIPWKDDEHGQAIKRIAAQDLSRLLDNFDIFGPMLYHKRLSKEAAWIGEMVDYYWESGRNFISLIEYENEESEIEPLELKEMIEYGTKPPSLGVGIFSFKDLTKNKEKFEILKKIV